MLSISKAQKDALVWVWAISPLSKLGIFNKKVPGDLDLGAMGVPVVWTAQLSSFPNFSFEYSLWEPRLPCLPDWPSSCALLS